jgi:hypothetical protein
VLVRVLLALAFVILAAAAPAWADSLGPVCDRSNPLAGADDLVGIASPCLLAPGSAQIDAIYLQNASRIGQTALAAYPMFRVRAGFARRLEAVVDLPSQIAESGPGNNGLYPMTHLGYGLNYQLAQSARSALALITEVLPPTSRFAPVQSQPKYLIGLTSDLAVNDKVTLGATASGVSSGEIGFERVLPSLAMRLGLRVGPQTEIVTALGSRLVGRHQVGQSFGDVTVTRALTKRTIFNVGVGTTFNEVANCKSHYLASGFNYRM